MPKEIINVEGTPITVLYHPPPERVFKDYKYQMMALDAGQTEEDKYKAQLLSDDLKVEIAIKHCIYEIEGDLPEIDWINSFLDKSAAQDRYDRILSFLREYYYTTIHSIAEQYFIPRSAVHWAENAIQTFLERSMAGKRIQEAAEKNL